MSKNPLALLALFALLALAGCGGESSPQVPPANQVDAPQLSVLSQWQEYDEVRLRWVEIDSQVCLESSSYSYSSNEVVTHTCELEGVDTDTVPVLRYASPWTEGGEGDGAVDLRWVTINDAKCLESSSYTYSSNQAISFDCSFAAAE